MCPPTARRASRLFLLPPASLAGVRGRRILEGEAGADFMEPLISSARAAAADHELEYVVALEAERRGSRPPRLG